MVDRELIAGRLADLDARIGRVRAHSRASANDLERDVDALEIVSFNLMLAVQACAERMERP